MGVPQKPWKRKKEKMRRTKKLAAWREAKLNEAQAPAKAAPKK